MNPKKSKPVPSVTGARKSFYVRPIIGALMFLAMPIASVKAVVYTAVIDQAFLAPSYFGAAVYVAQSWGQTFTVGLGGQLVQVDLQLSREAGVAEPVQLEIRQLIGGLPDLSTQGLLYDTQIAASAVPIGGIAGIFTTSVVLGADSFAVVPGDRLAILLSTSEARWYLWSNEYVVDGYAAGTALNRLPSQANYSPADPAWGPIADAGFRTWVVVPEPAGLLPVSLVLLAGLCYLKRSPSRSGFAINVGEERICDHEGSDRLKGISVGCEA